MIIKDTGLIRRYCTAAGAAYAGTLYMNNTICVVYTRQVHSIHTRYPTGVRTAVRAGGRGGVRGRVEARPKGKAASRPRMVREAIANPRRTIR